MVVTPKTKQTATTKTTAAKKEEEEPATITKITETVTEILNAEPEETEEDTKEKADDIPIYKKPPAKKQTQNTRKPRRENPNPDDLKTDEDGNDITEKEEKQKSGFSWKMLALGVVGVIIGVFVFFLFIGRKNNPAKTGVPVQPSTAENIDPQATVTQEQSPIPTQMLGIDKTQHAGVLIRPEIKM